MSEAAPTEAVAPSPTRELVDKIRERMREGRDDRVANATGCLATWYGIMDNEMPAGVSTELLAGCHQNPDFAALLVEQSQELTRLRDEINHVLTRVAVACPGDAIKEWSAMFDQEELEGAGVIPFNAFTVFNALIGACGSIASTDCDMASWRLPGGTDDEQIYMFWDGGPDRVTASCERPTADKHHERIGALQRYCEAMGICFTID